jgi:hypothetical protein
MATIVVTRNPCGTMLVVRTRILLEIGADLAEKSIVEVPQSSSLALFTSLTCRKLLLVCVIAFCVALSAILYLNLHEIHFTAHALASSDHAGRAHE